MNEKVLTIKRCRFTIKGTSKVDSIDGEAEEKQSDKGWWGSLVEKVEESAAKGQNQKNNEENKH